MSEGSVTVLAWLASQTAKAQVTSAHCVARRGAGWPLVISGFVTSAVVVFSVMLLYSNSSTDDQPAQSPVVIKQRGNRLRPWWQVWRV